MSSPPDDPRRLIDLVSVGPATVADLQQLGITRVAQLRRRDPDQMHAELERLTGTRQDPCVRDVFACAIAQAEDPNLPAAQRDWWWWSRRRKGESGSGSKSRR